MSDKDNKGDFEVKDKRRFIIKNGQIIDTKTGSEQKTDSQTSSASPQEPSQDVKETQETQNEKKPDQREYDASYQPFPISFSSLVVSLSTSVMVHLGELPDPITRNLNKNLELARQSIDLLGMLEEKTKGNLTEDEARLIKESLYSLRIHYVNVCKDQKSSDEQ